MLPPIHPGNFETLFNRSEPRGGYAKTMPIHFWQWRLSTGIELPATGTGIVGKASINLGTTDLTGIQWAANADASDIAYLFYQLPMDYDPDTDKLRLAVRVRKTKSSDENTNLALVCNAKWFDSESTAGEALGTVLTSAALAAATAGTDWDDFEEVIFDLDGNGLKPGALLELQVYPNEQVGSSTMTLDLIAARLDYYGNASFNDRAARFWA